VHSVTHAPPVARLSLVDLDPPVLDEERVRDQLSAAEELHYVGHAEPAVIAAGSALAGVLRLCGASFAGSAASGGALLEGLLANGVVSDSEHELLFRLLRAHGRFNLGYAPDFDATLSPCETSAALALMLRLLEDLYGTPCGI
jgi:hypothetical protein